jgi:hypothetical protein
MKDAASSIDRFERAWAQDAREVKYTKTKQSQNASRMPPMHNTNNSPAPPTTMSGPRMPPQHENNAITLLYTNCLWLKHHDDPISILNCYTVWYIQSIYSVFQFCVIFLDTLMTEWSKFSIQKNNPKLEYRINTLNIPNSIKI